MIRILIGNQGSGKSALAVKYAKDYLKLGYNVYSNLPIYGCYEFSKDDIMNFDFLPNSVIVFDEGATYGLGSRGGLYKSNTTQEILEFFTMHRHYHIKDVVVVSPNFQDVLPSVRDNAMEVVRVKSGLMSLLGFVSYKKIGRDYSINESGEICYFYFWRNLSIRWFYRPLTYAYYDSWVRRELKSKDWEKWSCFDDAKIKFSFVSHLKRVVKNKYKKSKIEYLFKKYSKKK